MVIITEIGKVTAKFYYYCYFIIMIIITEIEEVTTKFQTGQYFIFREIQLWNY